MFKNYKGFTLIELLVVVLIIGILAAIALPQYRQATDKAKFATLMELTHAIADSNERYYMIHNTYSTNFDELDIEVPANSINGNTATFDWGYCKFNGNREIVCERNQSLKILFIKGYESGNDPTWKGYYCLAKENDERNNRLCQNLGGKHFWTTGCFLGGQCKVYRI